MADDTTVDTSRIPRATPDRVGDRYVLRGELGRGGMATVHRAVDEVLEREVAVKLLHAHLATDPAFLDRFRREARAAATLGHPNVVAVHDWGETEDGAYLVLQLIEGPSLREVLRQRGRLAPAEVATVLAPASTGLGAAHAAGLVHRDVKPENLLLGRDGTVRVTDFGLARAAASATSTFGADVLVGSPHYLSPEAVRGRPLDPRADVYALGVVLFECLTGRPPHEGESPFATAVQHTSRRVPPPSEVVDGVPPALDELVVAATAHDPEDRPDDGADFSAALVRAVPGGADAASLLTLIRDTVVVPPAFEEDGTDDEPVRNATRSIPAEGATTALVGPAAGGHIDPGSSYRSGGDLDEDADDDPSDGDERRHRRRRWPLVLLLVLGLLAASAAGGYLLWDRVLAPVIPVPAVVGAPGDVAADRLEEDGFEVRVANQRPNDLDVPADHVLEQSVTGTARRGATVVLTLSAGPRQVEVPDVLGEPAEDAAAALVDAGLSPATTEEFDEDIAAGLVLASDPAPGTTLDETSEVTLLVSRGPRPIEVEDLRGRALDDATALLSAAGLEIDVTDRRYDEQAAAGTIIDQEPGPGATLHRGDTVSVVVSRGPEPIEVPNLRGMRAGEAVAELEALGFEVEIERRGGVGAFFNPDRVFEQDPGPGATRHRGDTVTIYAYEE